MQRSFRGGYIVTDEAHRQIQIKDRQKTPVSGFPPQRQQEIAE